MRLIDTHCHLCSDKLAPQAEELILRAREARVAKIINITFDEQTLNTGLQQLENHPDLALTVGIQPHDADQFKPELVARMENIAHTNPNVVAIGEIGLDGFHKFVPMPQQIICFEEFLEIALRCGLPVVVHVRDTFADVHARLKSFAERGGRGVIHCFTGTLEEGDAFLDLGFYLSFSGIVTFKNSDALREVARHVPSDRILVETDSPYLAPIPYRGKQNEPAWVSEVARCIAQVRGVSLETLAEQTTLNALNLFHRLKLS
ncbi:MAG: TatD family deoxyribonuclease [Betaproteobacteria bacterium]|nr:TatD family deoxyribonuclease [Betaproteobacteria bacterium]